LLISPSGRSQLRRELEKLENPISLKVFTSDIHCPACADTVEICKTLTELTDKITVEEISLDTQKELAAKYEVEYPPTIRIESGGELTEIRYTGIPAGGEFAAFIQTLVMVSTQTTDLGHLKEKLIEIQKPVVVRTVVTPTTCEEDYSSLVGD
jgi:alkyl hydroperoxide reductase subunit AhpF